MDARDCLRALCDEKITFLGGPLPLSLSLILFLSKFLSFTFFLSLSKILRCIYSHTQTHTHLHIFTHLHTQTYTQFLPLLIASFPSSPLCNFHLNIFAKICEPVWRHRLAVQNLQLSEIISSALPISMTRFGKNSPLLQKKSLTNVLKVYMIFGKVVNTLWENSYAFEQIFIVVNGQILENNLVTLQLPCPCGSVWAYNPSA